MSPWRPAWILGAVTALATACGSSGNGEQSPAAGGTGGAAGCAAGLTACGTTCVDAATDPLSCGACGQACGAGEACVGGVCGCQGGLTSCDGVCVDVGTDEANCRACGVACLTGESCSGTAGCTCLPGLEDCTGTCTDVSSDGANCGACGAACSAGLFCSNGVCRATCDVGLTACGSSCVDLATNAAHCGTCDAACAAGRTCEGGACTCEAGDLTCDGSCVDPTTSPLHCGSCNHACSGGATCVEGTCACPSGQTSCAGACVNTESDPNHCGACGVPCGTTCVGGECLTGTGGAGTGGAATGGAATGGAATGGAATGGAATGGASTGGGGGLGEVGPADVRITLDTATTHQTLVGFGAAVAWYQGTLTAHPQKSAIYQAIFADLGLDILRFRNRYQRSNGDTSLAAEVEIFQRGTASLGHAPIVLLTSWSPPASLKANNAEDCTGNADCTLRKSGNQFVYADFATYWYDSIQHYQAQGIPLDYVSLQNELDFIPNGWEGCRFDPTETASYPGYDTALDTVTQRLASLATRPRVLGPEVLGVHYSRVANYVAEMNMSQVYGVAHHLYEMGNDGVWDWRTPGPDSFNEELRETKTAAGSKPLFQTEFQTDADNFTDGGFETAWLIHNSMVEEGTAAWLYWDLIWDNSGLVALQGTSYTIRDQYYSLRHYSRFTDPGYVRVGATSTASDIRVSAYASPSRDRVTLVVLNTGTSQRTVALDPNGYGATTAAAYRTVYNPGSSQRWVDQGGLATGNVVTLPARSVATLVLE